MLKSAALTNLSQQLNGDNPPRSEMRLYVTITKMSCHTEHDFGNFMKYGQTVDHSIIERINDLVQEGITSVHEVKTCLRYYVQDVLFNGKEKPDLDCRAFYPTSKDIRNHIQESLRQGRCSNLDQENVAMLVSALEREEPTSKVLFRPYCYTSEAKTTIPEADDDQINVEETLAKQCDRTLLFCYQSRFMAELLKQYGNNVTCLDATNKTTDYSLPLFFLVVKTPTNYMVAGVFVVQYETSACISEALSVFKSWDPEYLPKYFMVDFCQAEISAISEVFPQSEVMLCNFHREQAWERWVKKKENDVPPDQKDALLGHFRKIANSSSREEFDEAYKCLKNSVFWRNDKVASYFETQWMPAAKMWVQYHRMKFGVVVTTNNGTETQNRILKEHYLRWSHGRRSLSSLITVVVKKFLPERQSVFIQQNVERSAMYRKYHEYVPKYLHNRPPKVIRHIMARINTALDYEPEDVAVFTEPGVFSVKSSNPGLLHTVNFHTPQCTCQDFLRHKLPCKHFCAIFRFFKEWSFEQLPREYIEGPMLSLHSNILSTPESGCILPALSTEGTDDNILQVPSEEECVAELPKKIRETSKLSRRMITDTAHKITSVVIYCKDERKRKEAHELMLQAYNILRSGCESSSSGLVIRGSPTKGCSGQASTTQQAKRIRLKALQHARRHAESWKTRGRVGKQASELRATFNVAP